MSLSFLANRLADRDARLQGAPPLALMAIATPSHTFHPDQTRMALIAPKPFVYDANGWQGRFWSRTMASPGALVKTLADVLGLPEPTVVVHDRNLVVAGLRSKSGRGWSAAKVTPRDAAHLLTAILGSSQVKDSARAVHRYGATRACASTSAQKSFTQIGIPELAALGAGHSFIDAVEALIAASASGSLRKAVTGTTDRRKVPRADAEPIIEIAATSPGTVGDVRIAGLAGGTTVSVTYDLPSPWDIREHPPDDALDAWETRVKAERTDSDLEELRRISGKTIMRLGKLLAPVSGEE
jgi:hypothetical protein